MICLVNLSLGNPGPYQESSQSIAVQRVIEKGGKNFFVLVKYCNSNLHTVYVTVALGNDGDGGLQTGGDPANLPGAMAVGSVDNTLTLTSYTIIAPDSSKILYQAGTYFGAWKSIVNSTIVVNG